VPDEARPAWQPFTFGGVAAFATAPLRRLLLVQIIVAVIASASITWFIAKGYGTVISRTIEQLPETAAIEAGTITGINSPITAETKFVSVQIDTGDEPQFTEASDLQIEFRKENGRACSLLRSVFGCVVFDYPGDHKISLARSRLEPWWGARQPLIWALTFVAGIVYMFLSWALLAIIWSIIAKLIAWFADRQLGWFGAWKLSSAALMPGALLLAVGVRLYHWQAIDLIALSVFFFGHAFVGLVYVLGAPFKCPKLEVTPSAQKPKPPKNPFA
jgi:hypothetical protein